MIEEQKLLHPTVPQDPSTPTLETVATAIATWRADKTANKIARNEKTPEHIWDMVFVLLETQPESDVLAACGLDKRQLNKAILERQELNQIAQPESCNSLSTHSYQKSFSSLTNERKGFGMNPIATVHKNNGAFMNLYAVNSDTTALVSAFLQA